MTLIRDKSQWHTTFAYAPIRLPTGIAFMQIIERRVEHYGATADPVAWEIRKPGEIEVLTVSHVAYQMKRLTCIVMYTLVSGLGYVVFF